MITRRPWTDREDQILVSLAKANTPNHITADLLDRSQAAVYTRRRVKGWIGDGYGPNDHKPPPPPDLTAGDEVLDHLDDLSPETSPGEVPGRWTTVWSRSYFWGAITITKQRRTT